eukprot:Skav215411  [mRNA]  locus=scaffold356:146656:153836:- [translate_table: standard]
MPPSCNKCNRAPPYGADSWCLACSAVEQLQAELRDSWGVEGSRSIVTDLLATTLRQVRALRRLGLASGAGPSRLQSVAAPPVEKAAPSGRKAEASPPQEKRPADSAKEHVKEEKKAESSGEESYEDEEEGEEEAPCTTTPKSKAAPSKEESRSEKRDRSRRHEEEAERYQEKSRKRSRSDKRGREELPRLHSRRRHSREDRGHHHDGATREKRKRKRHGHRGGSKHQRVYRAEADPGGGLPPLTRNPTEGEEVKVGDPTWSTLLPSLNTVVEVCLAGSSITSASEDWFAVLVVSASRPHRERAGVVLKGKFLGCESELKATEVANLVKNGLVHLCGAEVCPEVMAAESIHATRARLWSLERFDAAYLTREGKATLTKARKKEATPSERPTGTGKKKPPKDDTGERPKKRRKRPQGGIIQISSEEGEEEEMFGEDEEPGDMGAERRGRLKQMLAQTRERIARQGRELAALGGGDMPPGVGAGFLASRTKAEDPSGGRRAKRSRAGQEKLKTGTWMDPRRATPLALTGPEDTSGFNRNDLIAKLSKKHDTSSALLAQAVQSGRRKLQRRGRKSGPKALAKALEKVIGKKGKDRDRRGRGEKTHRGKGVMVKGDPEGDDPEDSGEGEESSSQVSDSESDLDFEPPLRKKAAKRPGSVMQMLVKHAQDQLDRGALMEDRAPGEDPLIGGVKLSTYFALLIRPYAQPGHPLLRELYALAQTMDLLRSGRLSETADALASRFIAVHTALTDGSWATASYLEMFPMEPVQSTTTATMLQAQKHRKMVMKSQGFPNYGNRGTWGSGKGRGNYGAEKGRKGEGNKGKQKGKGLASQCANLSNVGKALAWLLLSAKRLEKDGMGSGALTAAVLGREPTQNAMHRGRGHSPPPLFPLPEANVSNLHELCRVYGLRAFCSLPEEVFSGEDAWALVSKCAINGIAGKSRAVHESKPTKLQMRAGHSIRDGVKRMLTDPSTLDRSPKGAEKELSSRFLSYTGEEIPKMQIISLKQVLPALPPSSHSGTIDALDLVSDGTRRFLLNPLESLKTTAEPGVKLKAKVHVQAGDELALCKLLVERRIAVWVPREDVLKVDHKLVLNGMFAVGKGSRLESGEEIQRLIMNLVPTNSVLRQAQGAVAALPGITQYLSVVMEGSDQVSLYQSDMSAAFYLFRIPPCWNRMMCFNISFPGEVLGLQNGVDFHLACGVIPMGWGSSVSIMQEIADRLTTIGRLPVSHKVRRTAPLPLWLVDSSAEAVKQGRAWFHVYLDNFCAMEKKGGSAGLSGQDLHEGLEDAWDQVGILSSVKKKVSDVSSAQELGALIDGSQRMLGGSGDRLLRLIQSTLVVISKPRLKRKWIQVVVGRWVHVFSFRRPLMAVLEEVWKVQSSGPFRKVNPHKIRSELFGCCLAALLSHTFLGATVSKVTTASDASMSGGAVGVSKKLTQQGQDFVAADRHPAKHRQWPGRATRAQRAEARRHILLADVGVTANTLNRYYHAVNRMLPALTDVVTEAGMDEAIAGWIEDQFHQGHPLNKVGDALSGFHHFEPWTRRKLPKSWRLYSIWRRFEVPCRAPPITQDITLAMAGWCLMRGELTMSALLLLGFHALLRTGELLQVRAIDFMLQSNVGLVSLPSSKSGVRNNSKESVSLHDPIVLDSVQAMVDLKYQLGQQHLPCWSRSGTSFRKLFQQAAEAVGAGNLSLRPYSLRRGGATYEMQSHGLMERTLIRGRWKNSNIARLYICDGLSLLPTLKLSWEAKLKIARFSSVYTDEQQSFPPSGSRGRKRKRQQ